MHTFEGEVARFHFNGQPNGDETIITITRRNAKVHTSDDTPCHHDQAGGPMCVNEAHYDKDDKTISVPLSDLKAFMADYIRGYRIARLEQASTEEILTGDIR